MPKEHIAHFKIQTKVQTELHIANQVHCQLKKAVKEVHKSAELSKRDVKAVTVKTAYKLAKARQKSRKYAEENN